MPTQTKSKPIANNPPPRITEQNRCLIRLIVVAVNVGVNQRENGCFRKHNTGRLTRTEPILTDSFMAVSSPIKPPVLCRCLTAFVKAACHPNSLASERQTHLESCRLDANRPATGLQPSTDPRYLRCFVYSVLRQGLLVRRFLH